MPIYKYQCPKCNEIEVAIRLISEEDKAPSCPACDTEMCRQYGIQTVIFKGAGWGKDAK
jgi:putative FmdB family regulatory protein